MEFSITKFGVLLHRGLFGTRILPGGFNKIVTIAKKAEALAYDSVWVSDESWWTPDPMIYGALLVERTKQMRVGIVGTNPYVRHPLGLALSYYTFGEIGGTRAAAGICAGSEARLKKLGIERVNPLAFVRDMVALIRELARNRVFDFQSESIKISGVSAPWIKKDLSVYICANGPKMHKLAGTSAEGIMIAHFPPSYVKWGRKLCRLRNAGQVGHPRNLTIVFNP